MSAYPARPDVVNESTLNKLYGLLCSVANNDSRPVLVKSNIMIHKFIHELKLSNVLSLVQLCIYIIPGVIKHH